MTDVLNLFNLLEQKAKELKSEKQKSFTHHKVCENCFKVKLVISAPHDPDLCNLICKLREEKVGFNDRLFFKDQNEKVVRFSKLSTSMLFHFGLKYMQQTGAGAVFFAVHPLEDKEKLEKELEGTDNSASIFHDPVHHVLIYHFYVAVKMLKNLVENPMFIDICSNCSKLLSWYLVPMVQLRNKSNVSIFLTSLLECE